MHFINWWENVFPLAQRPALVSYCFFQSAIVAPQLPASPLAVARSLRPLSGRILFPQAPASFQKFLGVKGWSENFLEREDEWNYLISLCQCL